MTPDMIMTMIILAFVICLFVFEWVRVDVVGIMMMVLLPLIGLISPKEAFVGLSSNAVCSIIAVIIIGAGLDKTGVMNKVAKPILALAGKSEGKIMLLISGTVGIISSMMQNITAPEGKIPTMKEQEKRYIQWVLEQTNWNKTRAAEIMEIDRVSLWRKIKAFKLE